MNRFLRIKIKGVNIGQTYLSIKVRNDHLPIKISISYCRLKGNLTGISQTHLITCAISATKKVILSNSVFKAPSSAIIVWVITRLVNANKKNSYAVSGVASRVIRRENVLTREDRSFFVIGVIE